MSREPWVEPSPEKKAEIIRIVREAAETTAQLFGPSSTAVAVPAWLILELTKP